MTKKTYSLSQLVQSVKSVINNTYAAHAYWVTAELVKVNIKGGHYYLELADAIEGMNAAQMKGVIWRTQVLALQTNLGSEFQQLLQAGNRILISVTVTFHELYGLSLSVHDIDPTYTYGEIELKKKQTIERLQKEGIFDLQRFLKLPLIVKKIVVVGSPETSGFRDFISEMTTNNLFRNFTILQIATSVQGDKAIGEICAALQEADSFDADAIVLIRGGGSKMDLNVFNDYQICKTIAELRLPLITGIGHQTDEVVADLVAHISQITPTAVAKFLYIRVGTFRSDLQTSLDRILTQIMSQLALATEQFTNTNKFLTHYFQHIVTDYRTDLQVQLHRIQLFTSDILAEQSALLELLLNRGGTASTNYLHILHDLELPGMLDRILTHAQNIFEMSRLEVNVLREKLELLNPLQLLKVGYTISSVDQYDLAQFKGDLIGKEMQTLTDHFTVYSTITKIQK